MGLQYSREVLRESEGVYSYDYLNQHLNNISDVIELEDGLYRARILPGNHEFIAISAVRDDAEPRLLQNRDVRIFCQYGLKFHISLPEWNRSKFKKGWGIVNNILRRHQVADFKVIREPYKMSDNPPQRGKDITIYASSNPNITKEQWLQIMQEITQELTRNEIPPGYRPPKRSMQDRGVIQEEGVTGSNYVSYRYENHQGRWPRVDPCSPVAGFIVSVPDQLPVKAWRDPGDHKLFKCCNIM